MILGILMVLAGILALIHPFPASLTVVIFVAWSFIWLGRVLQLLSAFSSTERGGRIWLILLGVVMIWIGIVLNGNPIEGLITLTFVVALSLLVSGVAKLIFGWSIRSIGLGGGVVLSGFLLSD